MHRKLMEHGYGESIKEMVGAVVGAVIAAVLGYRYFFFGAQSHAQNFISFFLTRVRPAGSELV